MKHVSLKTSRGTIRGMWHVGNHTQPVLLVHGYFGASRVGHGRLYVKIANALAENKKYDVLRVDAIGAGESDGAYEDISLPSFLDDFNESITWMNRQEKWSDYPIVIGHSMGANVALLLIKKTKCKGAILISPEIQIDGAVDKLLKPEQLDELRLKGRTVRKGIPIKSEFIDEIRNVEITEVATGISAPCAVIQGTEDEIFDCSGGVYLADLINSGKFFGIEKADHNFIGTQNESKLIKAIIASIEWIDNK